MKKITACFIVFITFTLFWAVSAYAVENRDIEVHVNGIALSSDLKPVISSDRVYVPLRTIAETLNYKVDYQDATKTAIISNTDTKIKFSLNDMSATVNGLPVQMPVPAMIINGRIMAPVRFVAESFNCLVNWSDWIGLEEGPRGLVDIYSEYPVNINGQLSISSIFYSMTKPVGDPEGHEITCNYALPQIHGLSGKDYESAFNKSFSDKLEDVKKEVAQGGSDAIDSAKTDGFAYDYSYEGGYTCGAIQNDIVTITLNGYMYSGGAHGMGIQTCYVIDVNKSKTLSLHDVLQPGQASEDAVVSVINALANASPDEYGLFNEENKVSADEVFRTYEGAEKTGNFYFEGGNIVIFFQPYEIGPYAAGFITFKIPAEKISGFIRPEYLKILR